MADEEEVDVEEMNRQAYAAGLAGAAVSLTSIVREVPAEEEGPEEALPLNPALEADAKQMVTQMNATAPAGITFAVVDNPMDDGCVIQGKDAGGNVVRQTIGIQISKE